MRLAVVSESDDRLSLLESIGPDALGLGTDDWQVDEFWEQAIMWLDPESLQRPEPGSKDFEIWEKLVHSLCDRLVCQVVRIRDAKGFQRFLLWLERLQTQVWPAIQAHKRHGRIVTVLVFECTLEAASMDLESTLRRLETLGWPAYLMTHQLRVAESRLVHARHVWPLAVALLLSRLMGAAPPESGLYTWRGLEIHEASFRGFLQKHISVEMRWFLAWFQSVEDADLATMLPTWRPNKPSSIEAPAAQDAEDDLDDFVRLASEGARQCVERITSSVEVETQASSAGEELRRTLVSHPRTALQAIEHGRKWWQDIAGSRPPNGGPGLLPRISSLLAAGLEKLNVSGQLDEQLKRWREELNKDEDFRARRSSLNELADELQQARDRFVGLAARCSLGVLCAVLVGFTIAQIMQAWSILATDEGLSSLLWRSGMTVWLGLAALLGVLAGILIPYALERWRGRKAARSLRRAAVQLKSLAVGRLNGRLNLCLDAANIALDQDFAAGHRMTRQIMDRAHEVVRPSLKAPLAEFDDVDNEEEASDDVHLYDRKIYLGESVVEFNLNQHRNEEEGEEFSDTLRNQWHNQAFSLWKKNVEQIDERSTGWFPQSKIDLLLKHTRLLVERFITDQFKSHFQESIEQLHADHESLNPIKSSINRWFPGYSRPEESSAMMSLHFRHFSEEIHLQSFIVTESPNLADFINKLPEFAQQAEPIPQELPNRPFVVAQILQELRVQFDPEALKQPGSALFFPVGIAESTAFVKSSNPTARPDTLSASVCYGEDTPPMRTGEIAFPVNDLFRELLTVIPDAAIDAADRLLLPIDKTWLETEFFEYCSARMKLDGIQYEPERHDCDDFARRLRLYATDCLRRATNRPVASHTLSECSVVIQPAKTLLGVSEGNHAINLVRCTDGHWYFLEPQCALSENRQWMAPLKKAMDEGLCKVMTIRL